jgi:hypothetical protein
MVYEQTVPMEQRKFFFEMKELISRKHASKLREKMYSTSPPIVPYLCTASLSLNVFFFLSFVLIRILILMVIFYFGFQL